MALVFARRDTVGLLPFAVALLPAPIVIAVSLAFIGIMARPATVYAPEATASGLVDPARFSTDYCRGIGLNFVINYTNWTPVNYNYRTSKALLVVAPQLKPVLLERARQFKAQSVGLTSVSHRTEVLGSDLVWESARLQQAIFRYRIRRHVFYGLTPGPIIDGAYTLEIHWSPPDETNPFCAQVAQVHFEQTKEYSP